MNWNYKNGIGKTSALVVLAVFLALFGVLLIENGVNIVRADPSPNINTSCANSNYPCTNISPTVYPSTSSTSMWNDSGATSTFWAWNDVVGWIDFHNTPTHNVLVAPLQLKGYASSSVGDISLDCATSRNGNICGVSNYVVNATSGVFYNYAWNDVIGWIKFKYTLYEPITYGVTAINVVSDEPPSDFEGYAWNDVVGWISFCGSVDALGHPNCANVSSTDLEYKVRTSWFTGSVRGVVESNIFDTGFSGKTRYNYIMWRGDLPIGTAVRFQLAVSDDPSGPWNFVGPSGSDSYYTTMYLDNGGLNYYMKITNYADYFGKRYFRYKVTLISDQTQVYTPRIDDIIVSWSQ